MIADRAEIERRAADLAGGMMQAQHRLRDALLAGADTGQIRHFIAEAAAELATVRRAHDALLAAEEARDAAQIASVAGALAAEAAGRLGSMLATLTPPPAPGAPT